MSTAERPLEASAEVAPPPAGEDLPYDDGEPMESDRHRGQMNLLIDTLADHWADRQDFYAGGNMFVYFSAEQAKRNDFRGPDVFVVLDTVRRSRKSWVVWEEGGKVPDVVIELLSESTERIDRGEKKRIYERVLHVPEYFLFDPFTARLEGLRLSETGYRPIEPEATGRLRAGTLGLELGVRPGSHHGVEAAWLRWFTPQGEVLPTGTERAEAERVRAETERARAEAERVRAETERARAEELAAKLAAYERRFGPLAGSDEG